MIRPLKIGIVANTAFNIYNFRLGLIKALQQEGHQVVAIAPNDGYSNLIRENKIDFVEIKNLARKGTNPVHDLRLLNEFRRIYKERQLDVVLQYTIKPNIYGTLAAVFTGAKTICTVTGLGYTFLNESFASKAALRLYRFAFSFADKVLFQNNDDVRTFLDNSLVNAKKIQVVPGSGIDIRHFHPGFCAPKNDEIIRFLMIGRLLKDKGVYEFVEASRQIQSTHPGVEFHLLGEIDNDNPSSIRAEELQDWIKKGYIHYHPHAKDTRPHICQADCVVLPSYREGMPRVVLEGMAMGKPCITTDAPGCRDAVTDGESGFLCKVADAASLQAIMEKFLSLTDPYKNELSVNARKRAEGVYSSEIINKTYLDLLRNLSGV